jgi:hypothetical protein
VLGEGHIIAHPKVTFTNASDLEDVPLFDGLSWEHLRQQQVESLKCSHLSSQYSGVKDKESISQDFVLLAMEAKEVTINQIGSDSQSFVV